MRPFWHIERRRHFRWWRSPGDLVPWLPWLSVALAEVIAAFDLSRRNRPRELALGVDRGMEPVLGAKQAIHSGLIGDYVTWLSVASPCSLSSSRSADAPI